MSEKESEFRAEPRQYELGVLIAPTLPQEKIPEEFGNLIASIEKGGGRVESSALPSMRALTYPVAKTHEHKKTLFHEAYFGWLRFYLSASAVPGFQAQLKNQEEILRFLIVFLPKSATTVVLRRRPIVTRRPTEVPTVAAVPMSAEQIDKEIEQLLSETKV